MGTKGRPRKFKMCIELLRIPIEHSLSTFKINAILNKNSGV
jgi:hypothetical protein